MPDTTCPFELVLRSPGSGKTPTVATIANFRPDPGAVEGCRRWLHSHGISSQFTGFSLACAATKTQFESLFGVKLIAQKPGPGRAPWRAQGAPVIPAGLSAWVENVVIPVPPLQF